jgi:alanine racemase
MTWRSWVEIKTSCIKHNLKTARKLIGPRVKLMAVVKSNAYGHGIIKTAKLATETEADWLGVDSLQEALLLRDNGFQNPLLIMGYILKDNLKKAVDNDLDFVVYNPETLDTLAQLKKKSKIHLKIETGTMRQGIFLKDLPCFIKKIKQLPNIQIRGIYTHFANIENTTDHTFAKQQLEKFKQALTITQNEGIHPLAHTACSAALILYPETHFNMVRLGLSMYGLWSSPQTIVSAQNLKRKINLKPALTWKSKIAQVKTVPANTKIGYGLTEKVNQTTKIAVIPVGYWDGYSRKLSSIGNILIQGKRCKVLGRICMNMMMVNVNHLKDIHPEEEVVLLGKQGNEEITADEIAQKIGAINYEIITGINPLIPRKFI